MIDLKKYIKDKDALDFIKTIQEDLSLDSQSEVFLKHKDLHFYFEPHGEEIEIFRNGESLGVFNNFDELLLNFKIDGKPFIEMVSEIDFD